MAFAPWIVAASQTRIIACGAGLIMWGVLTMWDAFDIMDVFSHYKPDTKHRGIRQLIVGCCLILIGTALVVLVSDLF